MSPNLDRSRAISLSSPLNTVNDIKLIMQFTDPKKKEYYLDQTDQENMFS